MDATFDIYEDAAGRHRWRLVAANNEIVADSGEGYASRSNAVRAIKRVMQVAPDADRLSFGRTHYVVYRDTDEQFHWRLVAGNGRLLATSDEGYASKASARRAIDRVGKYADTEERYRLVEVDDAQRWHLTAPNGRVLARSASEYETDRAAEAAIRRMRNLGPTADRLSREHFDIYEDAAGQFRWRLVAGNGQIIADGGQGYASKDGARQAVDRLKAAATASVVLDASLGLSIRSADGRQFEPMIPAGSELPIVAERSDFTTHEEDQRRLDVNVLQGESADPEDNDHLLTVSLTDLPARPKGEPRFRVRYALTPGGTLAVSLLDLETSAHVEDSTRVPLAVSR